MIKSFLLLLIVSTMLVNTALGQKKDSTQQKQYILVIKLSPNEWKAITDTSSLVINELGRAMTVDNAQVYRDAFIRQFNYIARRITVDSTSTKQK